MVPKCGTRSIPDPCLYQRRSERENLGPPSFRTMGLGYGHSPRRDSVHALPLLGLGDSRCNHSGILAAPSIRSDSSSCRPSSVLRANNNTPHILLGFLSRPTVCVIPWLTYRRPRAETLIDFRSPSSTLRLWRTWKRSCAGIVKEDEKFFSSLPKRPGDTLSKYVYSGWKCLVSKWPDPISDRYHSASKTPGGLTLSKPATRCEACNDAQKTPIKEPGTAT